MPFLMFLEALGGLGIFILGMKIMSEGLQRLAGERIRRSLEKLAGNRFSAAFLGSCLTALLQSSGAASIIIIGLVNAGLLSLYQALGMLIGTGLGTTFVVQLIAFRISFIAAPGIFAGVILKFFSRKRRNVHLGEVILGVSLLFFGLNMMEANFLNLKENTIFMSYRSYMPSSHIAEVLLGAMLTFFVQSGSAAIGIIIALSTGGLLPFEPALAMVLGEALGTSWLSAIGTISGNIEAKRTVIIYFIFTLFLLSAVLLMFPLFLKVVLFFSPHGVLPLVQNAGLASYANQPYLKSVLSRTLANAHTVFSMLAIFIFLPLVGVFTRSANKILPGNGLEIGMEARLKFIDFRVLNTPVIAFSQAGNEIRRMAELSKSMFCDVVQMFEEFDARKYTVVKQKESALDALQKEISSFLVMLGRQQLTPEISVGIPVMLQSVNGLENIGDYSEIIIECLRRKKEGKVYFSDTAMNEIREMATRVTGMLDLTLKAFDNSGNPDAVQARVLRGSIVASREVLKKNHNRRLSGGECTVIAGLLYIDIISAFDKISDLSMEIILNKKRSNMQ